MKKREDLFHLIQAMSKSEKRYFTLDAKKSSTKGSKYLALFQEINDMELYDEAKLKKKFGKNLRYDKSYLYEAIMRSMRDYRSANSYAARIKEMILDAKYLYERGLYEQCGERLEEAKGLAMDLDDQLSLLEINMADRELLRQTKGKAYEEIMVKLIDEKGKLLHTINEEFKYFDLSDRLVLEVDRRFELRSDEEIEAFKQRFPDSIFENHSGELSGRSELRYFQCSALYYQLLRDSDSVLKYYSKVVEWWDQKGKIKEEEFHKYVIDVSNLLHGYYSKEAYHEFPALIQKLEESTPKNHHDQGMVFQKVSIYKILYYINTGQSKGIDEVVESVQVGLDKYQMKSSSRNALIFNTSVMLFIQEKFEQCVKWNTRIIKGKKYITRRDIKNGVFLLNLIAVFELDELDEFEAELRKVNRYFSKRGMIEPNQFEKRVINSFKLINSAPTAALNSMLNDLKDYLVEIRNDTTIKVSLGLDELILLWVKSKLEKKSIIQQLKDQNVMSTN